MLEARHLVKQYHGVCALNDVSFFLGPSDVLGYLGPNGSGKTTTIGILTGLIEPTRGQVLLDGTDIRDQLVEYRARLGYVPEEPNLYPYLSGREFLQLVGRLRFQCSRALDDRRPATEWGSLLWDASGRLKPAP